MDFTEQLRRNLARVFPGLDDTLPPPLYTGRVYDTECTCPERFPGRTPGGESVCVRCGSLR